MTWTSFLVSHLTVLFCFDVKQSRICCVFVCVCVCVCGTCTFRAYFGCETGQASLFGTRYSLSKSDQIAVPVSSRTAAVRVVNGCSLIAGRYKGSNRGKK